MIIFSDDQGSLDNEEEEDVLSNDEESSNEGDDERAEDTEGFVKDEPREASLLMITMVSDYFF